MIDGSVKNIYYKEAEGHHSNQRSKRGMKHATHSIRRQHDREQLQVILRDPEQDV